MHKLATIAALSATALFALAGCKESAEDSASTTSATPTNTTPAWLLASMPEDAMTITEARATAKEGDTITIHGIIGGRMDALSTEASVFVLMDESVENLCVADDDHCSTPWDYCCADPAILSASNASVRLVGDDGRTLTQNLRNFGIEELDRVVIVGSVDPRPTPNVLNIRAEKIYVASN